MPRWPKVPIPRGSILRHGDYGCYVHLKCRCLECKAASRLHQKKLVLAHMRMLAADPTIREHGNITTYADWGCRCDPCSEANRAHCKAWRARRKVAA